MTIPGVNGDVVFFSQVKVLITTLFYKKKITVFLLINRALSIILNGYSSKVRGHPLISGTYEMTTNVSTKEKS